MRNVTEEVQPPDDRPLCETWQLINLMKLDETSLRVSTGPNDQLAQKHKHEGVVQRFEHTLQLLTALKIPT